MDKCHCSTIHQQEFFFIVHQKKIQKSVNVCGGWRHLPNWYPCLHAMWSCCILQSLWCLMHLVTCFCTFSLLIFVLGLLCAECVRDRSPSCPCSWYVHDFVLCRNCWNSKEPDFTILQKQAWRQLLTSRIQILHSKICHSKTGSSPLPIGGKAHCHMFHCWKKFECRVGWLIRHASWFLRSVLLPICTVCNA